ncbi:hypothetical protein ACOME3_006519 [Neoechinorhynchus agilis]
MLQALEKLKDLNIVHEDLKLGNIMMANCLGKPEQFKLIDFGLEVQLRNQESLYGYLQTSYYRAPEMIVSLPIAKSIDMKSLGCTIGELAVGRPMFPGNDDYETLVRITITRGVIPNAVLDNGVRTLLYYNRTTNGDGWVLKSPLERGIFPPSNSALHLPLVSLAQEDPQNTNKFLAMLGHLLELIPEGRVDPTVGIKQKWRRRSSLRITSGDHFRIFYEEKNQYDFVEVSINGKGQKHSLSYKNDNVFIQIFIPKHQHFVFIEYLKPLFSI